MGLLLRELAVALRATQVIPSPVLEKERNIPMYAKNPLYIPEQKVRCVLEIQGKCATYKPVWNWRQSKPPVKRSTVNRFTRASRLRLIKKLSRMKQEELAPALFITLTYPDKYAGRSPEQRTQDRKLFMRKLEKRAGYKIPFLWRIEWPERKSGSLVGERMPHFHLVGLGLRFIPWEVIRRIWAKIIHHKGPLATDVRKVTNGSKVAGYIVKYMAKPNEDGSLDNSPYRDRTGRHWGLTRKTLWPWAKRVVITLLLEKQVQAVKAVIAILLPWYDQEKGETVSLLGDKCTVFMEYLHDFGIDVEGTS